MREWRPLNLAGKKEKWLVWVLAVWFLLLSIPSQQFLSIRSSEAASSPQSSTLIWTTEPLKQVFIRVQQKFIGVVPGNYTEPTQADLSTMRTVFSLIDNGISKNDTNSLLKASSVAGQINYQIMPVNDSTTGNRYYVLLEGPDVNRGWGTYFFVAKQDGEKHPRVIIEAPHPVTDFNSQNIAYEVFIGSYPRAYGFFVSGVERTFGLNGQTDMAHRTLSIFEAATEAFAKFGSVVIQIHSFDAVRHPGYPWVIVSTGDGGANGALESITSHLQSSGISVGIFDGFKYEVLAGTNNAQGRYLRAVGAGFVHVEISTTVVFNSTLITSLQSSMTQSLIDGFRFPAYPLDPRIPAIALSVVAIYSFASFRFSKPKLKQ